MLPFGLLSAPKLFNAVADALEWHLRQRGIRHVFNYLDDFILVAPPASPECARALDILNESCVRLGIPIAKHKRDGSSTCLIFLGIEINTNTFQLKLPADRLHCLQSCLTEWSDKKACSPRALESLIAILTTPARWCKPDGHSYGECWTYYTQPP